MTRCSHGCPTVGVMIKMLADVLTQARGKIGGGSASVVVEKYEKKKLIVSSVSQ